jgi:hypothetical protein
MNYARSAHDPLQWWSWGYFTALAEQPHEISRETPRRRETGALAVDKPKRALYRTTEPERLFEHRVEHGPEVARRAVDNLQDFGGSGLALQPFVTLGSTFGKLALQIGYELFGIGQRAIGRRTHSRTSSGPTFRADHTVIDAADHRLSIRPSE